MRQMPGHQSAMKQQINSHLLSHVTNATTTLLNLVPSLKKNSPAIICLFTGMHAEAFLQLLSSMKYRKISVTQHQNTFYE